MKRLFLTILAAFLAVQCFAQIDFAGAAANNTVARLVFSEETAKPGETIWAGIELKMAPLWHTYWRFGGDAGSPTAVAWTFPTGVTAGDINWPTPLKAEAKAGDTSLFTYEYHDTVVLLVPIKIDASAAPGPVRVSAALKWMECGGDKGLCVFAKQDVNGMLTVGGEDKASANAGLIEQWRARLPQVAPDVHATARWDTISPGDTRAVIIDWESAEKPGDFYPYENQAADVQGATTYLVGTPGHIVLRKVVKKGDGPWPERLTGILVGKSDTPNPSAAEANLLLAAPTVTPGSSARTASLVFMLLFAFAGGLILNVMPCVLPVIALKVLGFVNQSTESPARVRKLGLVYGIGVLVSFIVLAGLAIGAQHAGKLAGWGDAFRNPQFQVIMTVLMALIALNLFGVFEITLGSGVMGSASNLAAKNGYGGAFFNGVLATLLATPCTAPFLGAAAAFALTQPPVITVLVFLAAGAGLAFPFVVICWQPRLLKILPKPGAWMEKFKIAMGFPMLATALWLVWGAARNSDDALWLELFLVVVALAAWIWGEFVQRGTRRKILAGVICLFLVALAYGVILEGELSWRLPANAPREGIDWKVWSPEAVAEARKEGHPVLVDFTARTCLTCKLNKATSLEIAQTRAKLKEIGAVAFEADFTHEDPRILAALREHNTSGVPLVLVYPKDAAKDAETLPTFLTPTIVNNALDLAAK